jgi:hypothetical protein
MPRWASRITLEIESIRVERVQEISHTDVRAEGFTCPEHDFSSGFCTSYCDSLVGAFRDTWDALNAKRGHGWDANPFVWCISFKDVSDNT